MPIMNKVQINVHKYIYSEWFPKEKLDSHNDKMWEFLTEG